jgi:hypothetical protein
MLGCGTKTNPDHEVVPEGVLTETFPEAPEPTTAVMLLGETTVKELADVPPKLTEVAPVKSLPVKVTVEPVFAVTGLIEVITGAGTGFTITATGADVSVTKFIEILTEYAPLWVAVYEAFVALAMVTPSLFH